MQKGDSYNGFVVQQVSPIEEIGVEVRVCEHTSSKARVIHLAADDEENLFCLAFKTYPMDNKGIPHILEHTVLCGSKKYPLHDPFFRMTRRSLSSFMNAMTGKIATFYPASSLVEKDFYNLLDVYVDAVFHPLLQEESFQQEGHYLSLQKGENTEELKIKGVVYNEMKGALADPLSRMWKDITSLLFPHHTYGYESGGNPRDIPDLTYAELKAFHEQFYHPSRCVFFFYGNIPTEKHLDYLEKEVLSNVTPLPAIPPVDRAQKRSSPIKAEGFYPSHDADTKKKTLIGFAYITAEITDRDDVLALSLIDSILMDNDASPLKRKVLDRNLCAQFDSMFDPDMRDIPYIFLFKGCDAKDTEEIEKVLYGALEEIASQPIPQKLIDASLHQLEFARSEIASSDYPYPLDLFDRTVMAELQGGSLIDGLKIHSLFAHLKKLCEDPQYLPSLIKKYFLNNPNMVRYVMQPKPHLAEEEEKEEHERLQKQCSHLDTSAKEKIVKTEKHLNAFRKEQETEDTSVLPILALSDLPKDVLHFPLEKETVGSLSVYQHKCFTNGVIYADIVFDLPKITAEDLPYIRLLMKFLPQLGSGGRNYKETLQYIHENVGGIGMQTSLNPQRQDPVTCYPTITLGGKCLSRKAEHLFALFRDTLLAPDYKDRERIKELLIQTISSLQNNLNSSAITYALKGSASGFSSSAFIEELWSGFSFFEFCLQLGKDIEKATDHVIEAFERLTASLFHLNDPHIVLTCDEADAKNLRENHFFGLESLAEASVAFEPWVEFPQPQSPNSHGRIISLPIAYNAFSLSTISMKAPGSAALTLSSFLLENVYLHRAIREEGGAYGSGARYDALTGLYQFYGYRDPHIFDTFSAFHMAVQRIAAGEFTEHDLFEAKLGYLKRVYRRPSPGSRGASTYFLERMGLTHEIRQEFQDKVLNTTAEEVSQSTAQWLQESMEKGVFVSYSNANLLEKNNQEFQKNDYPPLSLTSI